MEIKTNHKIDLSEGITILPKSVKRDNKTEEKYVEGILYKNKVGRYEINKEYGLYDGSEVELQLCGTWVKTKILLLEGVKYYAEGLNGMSLTNVLARIKL